MDNHFSSWIFILVHGYSFLFMDILHLCVVDHLFRIIYDFYSYSISLVLIELLLSLIDLQAEDGTYQDGVGCVVVVGR